MDLELEEELRNTDELLEILQAREGRLDKSNAQPLPSPPTVEWRKTDSQGEILYKFPRARRATVERLRRDDSNISAGPVVMDDDLNGGPANASEAADTILEELKRLLDTKEGDEGDCMPIQDHQPRSASNDWAIRSEMREERWKEARSSLVENILKGEDARSSSCQQCRSSAAIVCCRDCLPYPFLCAGCDEKRHGSFFVLHNRDSLISGFLQPLPPTTGFCQAAGHISVKQLVRLLPVEVPANICDCSNGTVLVSSGRPMILITMNGRYNLSMPHFSCASCGHSRETSLPELQRSGYWPGNIPASVLFSTDVLISFREMKMASPGMSFHAFVKMLDEKTIIFGRTGKISANVFSCSFNEWVAARYAVENMCQEEFFSCPACTPDMLAVCVDGNRKHYRFKNTASSTEKRGLLDQLFIQSDVEVSDFVDFVRKNNDHVSGRGLCGASHWTAAKELAKKSSSKLDEEGLEIAVCRHGVLLMALNMFRGEIYAYPLFLQKKLADMSQGSIKFFCSDVACKYFPYLQRVSKQCPELQPLLDMRPFLSVMHAKAHSWKCEEGAGSTIGEEVEQVNSFLSRIAVTSKYMSKSGRTDMITMQAMSWNKRKVLNLGQALVNRYTKTQKALQEQQHILEALKTELSIHDDGVCQWVSDVQQWAEERDLHGSGEMRRLQEEIEGLTVSIKRRTQRLYSQTDSNKRRHSLRLRRTEEKKKLAAAVEEYNSIADPSQQLGSVETIFTAETVAWPWQIPSNTESAPFLTKRKVFDKVMAVRRLQEERCLICKEMKQHWTVLTHKLSKFEALMNEISSKSLFPTLSDNACKGLLCIVRKKHYELKHLMQLVKAGYVKIFSQQDLMSEEEKLEQEDDVQDEGLSESDNSSDDDDNDFP
ncbi:uncharacterized protein [Pseudorasbora parva]|uniref:uncharacterized protein isoform X4 n=1 Tax=Pseudorasbora parva TaxID=51549 RepID=UPI00351DAAB5